MNTEQGDFSELSDRNNLRVIFDKGQTTKGLSDLSCCKRSFGR